MGALGLKRPNAALVALDAPNVALVALSAPNATLGRIRRGAGSRGEAGRGEAARSGAARGGAAKSGAARAARGGARRRSGLQCGPFGAGDGVLAYPVFGAFGGVVLVGGDGAEVTQAELFQDAA